MPCARAWKGLTVLVDLRSAYLAMADRTSTQLLLADEMVVIPLCECRSFYLTAVRVYSSVNIRMKSIIFISSSALSTTPALS